MSAIDLYVCQRADGPFWPLLELSTLEEHRLVTLLVRSDVMAVTAS